MDFKQYLYAVSSPCILESKGIRVTDELDGIIDRIYPQIHKLAIQSKQTGDDYEGGEVTFKDQYTGKDRTVYIGVINDSDEEFHGDTNPLRGVRINVAHTDADKITERWVRRLLVHELGIHSQDPKIMQFDVFNKRYDAGKRYGQMAAVGLVQHVVQDEEFDAYTGQMVDSLLKAAKTYKGRPEADMIVKLLDDTLHYIRSPEQGAKDQRYGIIADPEYWEKFHIYNQYADPVKRRKTYQRLYKAATDAKAILRSNS